MTRVLNESFTETKHWMMAIARKLVGDKKNRVTTF